MKWVQRRSRLSYLVLTLVAACLSAAAASAPDFKGQLTACFETRWATPTLSGADCPFALDGVRLKVTPPDPCSHWEWAKSIVRTVEALL
jgi:hypothetical protein